MIVADDVVIAAGGRRLVDGVSLAVAHGEVLALVGPNGAGKSTLLSALAGDRRLARGRISLGGHDVAALSPAALSRLRAVLPQRAALTAGFTALEVVRLGSDRGDADAAHRHLSAVALGHATERLYPTLSGGEQQRVQLARVLTQLGERPGCALLLDEPTAALDPHHQHRVLGLARQVAAAGHAVVVVLHDLTLALGHTDRIALLAAGRLLACEPPRAITAARLRQAFGVDFDLISTRGGALAAIARPPPALEESLHASRPDLA